MKIRQKIITYKDKLPYSIQLCNIAHAEPHYHEHELELIYCLKGHVDLVAGHQNVRINKGEIFSVDCGDIHYIYSDEDNLTILFHLDLTGLDISWEKLCYIYFACESCHCYPYQKKAMTYIKDIILTLSYFQYNHCEGSKDLANSLINILLKYFNWFNYENQTEQINMELHDRFYRILEYCTKNYNKKITISKLAEMEHINKNYSSQFLSNTVFMTFRDMIQYSRCYKAEQLLLLTDLPVSEISYSCGFSDSKYFYSSFKKWWKSTPSQHRARYAEYMNTSEEISFVCDTSACELLQWHITQWHTEKTLFSHHTV